MHKDLNIFGIRHLSPGGSFHLRAYLEQIKPDCILIEGPSDATDLLLQLGNNDVKPPVALLAYTNALPIETVLYPFASYSPEYEALSWGLKKGCTIRFIDLPTDILLKLKQRDNQTDPEIKSEFHRFQNKVYDNVAGLYGEDNYESYWERNFEHNLSLHSYNQGISLEATEIRQLVIDKEALALPYDHAYNEVREAHMRREIKKAISEGFSPEKIVVIVGAYHVEGIQTDRTTMSDETLKMIPRAESNMTLMPYSYHRLSSRTGYGAGNKAPYYFELMWQQLLGQNLGDLSAIYLSSTANNLRTQGHNASSATVIEAIRLANALTAMRGGEYPVLQDLHDAAITCFGAGELAIVADALNRVDIGTAIGSLPEGISQTPVQEDVARELKRLKLIDYKSAIAQELTLDLRENIKVKSTEAAFIDLNRSTFLHRLSALKIGFAKQLHVNQETASWAEKWVLQWTPEVEIEIVEANLKGETLEIAVAYQLKEELQNGHSLAVATAVIAKSCLCGLTDIFSNALAVLQHKLVETVSFSDITEASRQLSFILQYGSLRNFNLEPLFPLLQQLFLRAALLLVENSACDDKAATAIINGITQMETVAREHYELVNTEIWHNEIKVLAQRDDLNAKLSGIAFSILLEHNFVNEDECAREVSRRLSPGIPADIGAGWFEGLAGRNRYALLSRIGLWRELDNYVQMLDKDEFMRALVFLRRAFGDFESNQKNSVAELLGDLWGTGAESTAEFLSKELNEEETTKLDELNDFDFDF